MIPIVGAGGAEGGGKPRASGDDPNRFLEKQRVFP